MALSNLLAPRHQVQTSQGQPLAGGLVYLYLPGTTQAIPTYTTGERVTQNAFPVRLSSSGRAEIWVAQDCDMVITDRNGNTVITQDNCNPGDIGMDVSGLIPNGSFELDSDADQLPDSWDLTLYTGGTGILTSVEQTDGLFSFRFTAASAAGGGSLTTSDFFPVNGTDDLVVKWDMRSNTGTLNQIVRISWYDASFAFISSDDVYDSAASPTVWTTFELPQAPPGTARFAKLTLIGIEVGTGPGSTWFDRVSAYYPTAPIDIGVFGNVTVQLNEIITTNANGALRIEPNGTGALNLGSVTGGLASTIIYYNALKAAGWEVDGYHYLYAPENGTTAASSPITSDLVFQSQNNNSIGSIGYEGTNVLQLINFSRGGDLNVIAVTAAGVLRTMIKLDPDVGVTIQDAAGVVAITTDAGGANLYSSGTLMAETVAAASGGLRVNNLSTGTGLERVLTVSDLSNEYGSVRGDIPSVNNTLGDAAGMGVTLLADHTYAVEGLLLFTNANATPDVQFRFTTTDAHQDDVVDYLIFSQATPAVLDARISLLTTDTVLAQIAATDIIAVHVTGAIFTHATNAPTVQCQFSQQTTDANATTFLEGSFLKYTDLGFST